MSDFVKYRPELLREQPLARILCIGEDAALLASRALVLSKAGYDVHSCTSDLAMRLCLSAPFDFALICRSVVDEQSVLLTHSLRISQPSLQVIRLKLPVCEEAVYDFTVDTTQGPVNFLYKLGAIVEKVLARKT